MKIIVGGYINFCFTVLNGIDFDKLPNYNLQDIVMNDIMQRFNDFDYDVIFYFSESEISEALNISCDEVNKLHEYIISQFKSGTITIKSFELSETNEDDFDDVSFDTFYTLSKTYEQMYKEMKGE